MRQKEYISPIDQYIIDIVRDLRLKHNFTQEDLGNIMGLSRSFIKNIESPHSRAKYNNRHLNALADYLNISPKDFFPPKAFPVDGTEKEQKKSPAKKRKK